MCVLSMVYDFGYDKWDDILKNPLIPYKQPVISEQELKEFRDLLERARKYDKEHNQQDCELESKKEKLKELLLRLGKTIEEINKLLE